MLGYLLISILVLVFVLGEMIGLYIQCENFIFIAYCYMQMI